MRPRLFSPSQELSIIAEYASGASLDLVAFKYGTSRSTIARTLQRHGSTARNAAKLASERCGEKHPFFGKKRPEIGPKIRANRRSYKGENSPSWKGGKYQQANGYIQVHSPTHPHRNKMGYVLEHRLVMEKHLGRLLQPIEVVHHINRKVNDNRVENLKLFSNNGEHKKFEARLKGERL